MTLSRNQNISNISCAPLQSIIHKVKDDFFKLMENDKMKLDKKENENMLT